MKDKEFDDSIRNRLKDHGSSVPTGMWDRITAKKKKRRTGFFLYFLLPGLLLTGFLAIYYFPAGTGQKRNDIVFSKDHVNDSSFKRDAGRLSDNKTVSPQTRNDYLPAAMREAHPSNKQIKKLRAKNKKQKAKVSPFLPAALQTTGNNSVDTDVKSADHQDNDVTTASKPPVKENKPARPDSTSIPDITPAEAADDKFALELFVSPQMPVSRIAAADKSYEQALQAAGNMQLSYTIGARVSYAISKRLFVKIGAQYSQVNENMSFKDSQGNSINSTNHYKTISVPLLISYRIVNNGNLRLHVSAGSVLNIVSRYKGVIPSVSGQPIDLQAGDVYDKNVSASFFTAFDVSKHMNRRTDLFIEPWFSYRMENMVNRFYSFDQRVHSIGLSFGLRYRLFRNNDHQF